MSIQEISAYRTEDGSTFATREEAKLHTLVLEIAARVTAYVTTLEGTDRAKGRQAAAIRRFLIWEAGVREDPVEEPCPEI